MTYPHRHRILLADDHPLIRSGLRLQLEALGRFELVEAWDRESLFRAAAAAAPVDLALVDLLMPGMAGGDAIDALCALHPTLPVLVVTGQPVAPLAARWRGCANVRGVVSKGQPSADLRRVVDLALAGHPVWDAPAGDAEAAAGPSASTALTPRLHDVATQVAAGLTNREVAQALGLTEGTVKNYVKDIFKALGVGNRTQLALRMQQEPAARRPGASPSQAAGGQLTGS